MPTALITGITGQDGSYLAEFLLDKDTKYTASYAAAHPSTPLASNTYTSTNGYATCTADDYSHSTTAT